MLKGKDDMSHKSESGFSYIDVIIALVILMVGVLALISGITGSVLQTKGQEQQTVAKQVAASAMESIMSVKETDPNRLGWAAVGNVGSNLDSSGVPHGIFVTGAQPVFLDPGPDEVIGTADDTGTQVPLITRQIVISDICDPDRPSSICTPPGTKAIRMRSIRVTVTYSVAGRQRQEQLQTILTDYGTSN